MISTKGLLASLGSLLLCTSALAGFAGFQASRPLPSGVTLHDQDGGPSYYTTNGYANTIASRTFCNLTPFPACTGHTFTFGWDDPTFFFLGMAATTMTSQGNANTWLAQGYNTAFGVNGGTAGTLDLLLNNGIGFIISWQQLQRYISADRMPGAEAVGIYTYDEPTTLANGWLGAIGGIPTTTFSASATFNSGLGLSVMTVSTTPVGGSIMSFENGTGNNLVQNPYLNDGGVNLTPSDTVVSLGSSSGTGLTGTYNLGTAAGGVFTGNFASETVTQTAVPATFNSLQDTRFFTVGLAGATNLKAGAIKAPTNVNLPLGTAMSLVQSTPNGKPRHMDNIGSDIFWFSQAGDQGVQGFPAFPTGVWYQQHSNNYDQTSSSAPYTLAISAKGSHYGDFIDIQRQYNGTFSQPIWQILEPLNALTGSPYDAQPQELNWAVWSSIIHGAQGIVYFPNAQAGIGEISGCASDSPYCAGLNTPFTTSGVTGTINASGTCGLLSGVRVLTVTGSVTGYGLFPGMQSTAGITGGPATILQQCSKTTATATGTTGGVSSSSVTLTSISGTVQPPARIACTTSCNLGGGNIWGGPTWVTGGGPSVYTLHDNLNFSSTGVTLFSMPGTAGTYMIDQGTAAGGGMSFTQTTGMNTQITATNTLVSSLAPIIHSRFAFGLVTPSPNGYQFESGMTQFCGQGATQSLQSNICGTTTGIETMAKYYEGPTYTASTGDVISRGFYIFSDTRYTELDTQISATYTLAALCGVSKANVIGESRSISINNCSFTDTFANAWTIHVYQLQ